MYNSHLDVDLAKFKPFDVFEFNHKIAQDSKGLYAVARYTDTVSRIYHTRQRDDTWQDRLLSKFFGSKKSVIVGHYKVDTNEISKIPCFILEMYESIIFENSLVLEQGEYDVIYDYSDPSKPLKLLSPHNYVVRSNSKLEDLLITK